MGHRGKPNAITITYGVFDLLSALLYLYVFLILTPSRKASFTVIVIGVVGFWAAAGIGMISGGRWGRRLARLGCYVMLAACAVLVLLLVGSAAYLHGIYDGVGQAGAAIALIVAALAIEAVGLLPALQLAHLRRISKAHADGRDE
jgi:hypothetical protein